MNTRPRSLALVLSSNSVL